MTFFSPTVSISVDRAGPRAYNKTMNTTEILSYDAICNAIRTLDETDARAIIEEQCEWHPTADVRYFEQLADERFG